MKQKKSNARPARRAQVPARTLTAAQSNRLRAQFAQQLDAILSAMRAGAQGQFTYNLQRNVPALILKPTQAIDHAIRRGIVAASARYTE